MRLYFRELIGKSERASGKMTHPNSSRVTLSSRLCTRRSAHSSCFAMADAGGSSIIVRYVVIQSLKTEKETKKSGRKPRENFCEILAKSMSRLLEKLFPAKAWITVRVKLGFSEVAAEEVISLQKGKGKCPVLSNVILPVKYPYFRKIKKAKYDDIMSLMKFVPPVYKEFYSGLKSDDNENGNVDVEDID